MCRVVGVPLSKRYKKVIRSKLHVMLRRTLSYYIEGGIRETTKTYREGAASCLT